MDSTQKTPGTKKTKVLILFFCLIQVILIIALINTIYTKNNTFGVSITPIHQEDIVINPDQNFANFYEPKPNSITKFETTGFTGDFGQANINSDSLNELTDYSPIKDDSTYRIITLGDSHTFGWFVNTKDNYPEQLEAKLNSLNCPNIKKFEVINLGMGGYDLEYAAHRYEIRGQKYNPDLVLWLLKNDDFEQIVDYIRVKGDENNKKIIQEKRLDYYKSQGILGDPGWYEATQDLQNNLGMDNIVKYQEAKLYSLGSSFQKKLVIFSYLHRSTKYEDLLTKFTQSRPDTYFFNNIPELKKPEEAFPDSHPTKEGYAKITDYLLTYLTDNSLLPCN